MKRVIAVASIAAFAPFVLGQDSQVTEEQASLAPVQTAPPPCSNCLSISPQTGQATMRCTRQSSVCTQGGSWPADAKTKDVWLSGSWSSLWDVYGCAQPQKVTLTRYAPIWGVNLTLFQSTSDYSGASGTLVCKNTYASSSFPAPLQAPLITEYPWVLGISAMYNQSSTYDFTVVFDWYRCTAGYTDCSTTSCANLQTDPDNCGSCGHGCPSDPNGTRSCSNGTCQLTCNSGFTNCNGKCTVLSSDRYNCGTCGHVCASIPNATPTCNAGTCGIQCNTGYQYCSGSCTDTSSDPSNCSACGATCSAGQKCYKSACCTPRTCASVGALCGTIDDGCGGTVVCGGCPARSTCNAFHLCDCNYPYHNCGTVEAPACYPNCL